MFRRPALLWLLLAAAAGFALYFFLLDGVGLIPPDEPRYAAIGRQMAQSGDWITPRLNGRPWFEKPPLLYWMTAAGFRLGLGDELAPRLPVAALSAGFLVFYFLVLRREFGPPAAAFATAILGASALWLAYSRVAVTDLPLAVTFSAAVLLALRNRLRAAGAMLGLAVLAKGLVPIVLAVPLLLLLRKRVREALAALLIAVAVAAPWYVLVTLRHGRAFLDEFFLQHHFGRFATGALLHEQPFWFYVPVFLAALFPWTPLAPLMFRTGGDARRRMLLAVVIFGLVFFSLSRNKLPGYLLPLLPAAAALIGAALAEAKQPRWLLAASAALLGLLPAMAQALPAALQRGITHAPLSGLAWAGVIAAPLALLAARVRREAAVAVIAAATAAGAAWIACASFPVLDRTLTARAFWRQEAHRKEQLCVGATHRSWRYGLDYYSIARLPDCAEDARPLRIEQDPRRGARVVSNAEAVY